MVGFAKKPYLYVLGYDYSDGKDEAVLTIGKRDKSGKINIERVYHGQDAVELYRRLKIAGRVHYGI